MVIIGLTGGIATGKSTVSTIFEEHGIPVIDADFIARQVVEPGKPVYQKLRSEYGPEFFDSDNGGVLKREKLGEAIFRDINERRKLNAIIHPTIRWEMMKLFLYYLFTGSTYIVFDVPLLFESGYDKIIGTTIVIWW
uniref:Dephospho-CoA kinase n=1 Tax=Heterorhabditis bacteriophora TaxID=37862 RepID=A0A1I7XTH0_HETBA